MNYPDIECPGLGILRYDSGNDWYQGQYSVQQSAVTIYFSMDNENRLVPALERFASLECELADYIQQAKEYAVESLLEIKNEIWIERNQELPTPAQAKDQMVLAFLAIDSDGDVSFYWNDDDLVAGHFLVTMDNENNFISVEFPD